MSEGGFEELAASAAAEEGRLARIVATLEAERSRAGWERGLVSGWSAERVELLRAGLRQPRFADAEGLASELERARAELRAVRALRERLSAG